MNTKHTPTPWKVAGPHSDDIVGPLGNVVAGCLGYSIVDPSIDYDKSGYREANAAFIVLAVNSHAHLVRVLEKILVWDDGNLPGDILDEALVAIDDAKA